MTIATIGNLLKRIQAMQGAFLALLMLAMTFGYTLNVLVRELVPSLAPRLAWIDEISLFGLVWIVFLAIGLGLESGRHISMDAPFVEGESNSLLDVLPNNDSAPADRLLLNESLSKEIERALSTLTERERDVVKLFFGIAINHGLTLEEIGAKFDLTRERVRQIKEKAIRRLRHTSRSKLLKAYLG